MTVPMIAPDPGKAITLMKNPCFAIGIGRRRTMSNKPIIAPMKSSLGRLIEIAPLWGQIAHNVRMCNTPRTMAADGSVTRKSERTHYS
jgi:hypothetical protein